MSLRKAVTRSAKRNLESQVATQSTTQAAAQEAPQSTEIPTNIPSPTETNDVEEQDLLSGLTLTKNKKYIKIDENLLSRLNPEPIVITKANPFENFPEFLNAVKQATPLTVDFLNDCSTAFHQNPMAVKMAEMIGNFPIDWLALKRSAMREDNWDYSIKLSVEPKVTNQQRTGRCWQFASLNCLRYPLMKKLNVNRRFSFSPGYLFFYDKVERSDLFLEYIWSLRDRDLQDRIVRHLTAPGNHFIHDGGDFEYFNNLVKKYGLVPENIYSEDYNSMVSDSMNETLIIVLNHMALEIMRNKERTREEFLEKKKNYMKTIYDLVTRFLGEPPKPTDTFTWTYKDEAGETHKIKNMTPEKFYRTLIADDDQKIVIINDPRHPETYYMPSFVEYGLNTSDGIPKNFVNLPIDVFKKAVYENLKHDKPVWMGACMGKGLDMETNTSDPDRFDYESVLGTKTEFSKTDMLDMLTAVPNHAMLFNGVDVDEDENGNVTKYYKWRVENSWGAGDEENEPDKGYHRMMDSFFDKYVYEAVVSLKYFEPEVANKIMENMRAGKTYTYSSYDALGNVAQCKHCNGTKISRPKRF